MARKPKLPPGARYSSQDRITISIPDVNDGNRRKSQNKIDPSEPKSYATPDEAWAGYLRVKAFMAQKQTHSETLRGFWEQWTDVDHYHWGKLAGRSEQSVRAYRTRTGRFVAMYGERPINSINENDIHEYLKAGGKHSSLRGIATLFHDAKSRGLIDTHPCAQLARQADNMIARRRRQTEGVVPEAAQIEAMLTRAREDCYPRSLYGWLLTGVRTGMRGGEIDGMRWANLHGNRYEIREQWHRMLGKVTEPKHGSRRTLLLPSDVMAEIDKQRLVGDGGEFIWVNRSYGHWSHDSRYGWWSWNGDGGPSLRQLAGGCTIYRATRHYWASWAINVAGISPYKAALLYGHSDGGKLLTDTYAKPDHELAMREALEASERAQAVDLEAERKRRAA